MTVRTNVLVVDDDAGFVRSLLEFGRLHEVEMSAAANLAHARAMLRKEHFDLLLIDLALPDGEGLELLDEIDLSHCRVAVVTGSPSLESAARSVSLPIIDYVIKPVEPARMRALFDLARSPMAVAPLPPEHGREAPPSAPEGGETCGDMVTRSARMREVFRRLRLVAKTEATVLLCGESGTGKELAARALHQLSGRRGRFVAVNCGAVAPDLLASHLFGHEKGSFTGAMRQHIGFFEQADHGTLFLDEITEMPPALQVHLLRVLETRRLTRVGAMQDQPIDVRVVSATNRDPEQAVAHGLLRPDLYYRLCDFPLQLPPLRDRPEDIEALAEHFLHRLNERYGTARALSAESRERLRLHAWPGNIRELKNVIQRAFILAGDEPMQIDGIEPRAPADLAESSHALTFRVGTPLEEIERRMVLKTLAYFGQDKTRTAKALGVSVKTIYNKLAKYQNEAGLRL